MHLFDIDIPDGIRFQESEVLTPGNDFLTFDTGTENARFLLNLMLACYIQSGVKLEWGSVMT